MRVFLFCSCACLTGGDGGPVDDPGDPEFDPWKDIPLRIGQGFEVFQRYPGTWAYYGNPLPGSTFPPHQHFLQRPEVKNADVQSDNAAELALKGINGITKYTVRTDIAFGRNPVRIRMRLYLSRDIALGIGFGIRGTAFDLFWQTALAGPRMASDMFPEPSAIRAGFTVGKRSRARFGFNGDSGLVDFTNPSTGDTGQIDGWKKGWYIWEFDTTEPQLPITPPPYGWSLDFDLYNSDCGIDGRAPDPERYLGDLTSHFHLPPGSNFRFRLENPPPA
jgi:hypothetical protein